MNVEINFLEKKEKKNIAPYLLGFMALLLIISVISAILWQSIQLKQSISSKTDYAEQLEDHISSNQDGMNGSKNLMQLQETMDTLKMESLPTVAIYEDTLRLLIDPNHLVSYQNVQVDQFVLEARFSDLTAVANFVALILNRSYVQDVQLTSVSSAATGYEATITVYYSEDAVKKELGEDE
ncbi:hypothetical protein [Ornithinibacillus xuwenensis]|uniref:Uncharacterized protein n=1 Tax=Ornithinibacillus xuwenensis TaxID=3144668 RepID=A0ABU9XBD6_9BACI